MIYLAPAESLITLIKNEMDSYLSLLMKCGRCGNRKYDDYGWEDDSTIDEVLKAMDSGHDTFDYILFAGSIVCPPCHAAIRQEVCLRPHPVDNHLCMVYAGHEADGIDHECCTRHMFY